jgi:hypothetical protein
MKKNKLKRLRKAVTEFHVQNYTKLSKKEHDCFSQAVGYLKKRRVLKKTFNKKKWAKFFKLKYFFKILRIALDNMF